MALQNHVIYIFSLIEKCRIRMNKKLKPVIVVLVGDLLELIVSDMVVIVVTMVVDGIGDVKVFDVGFLVVVVS